MNVYLAEFFGTMIFIIMGNSVVANLLLNKTHGSKSDGVTINIGWGVAVMVAAYLVGWASGCHINPAFTIAIAIVGNFSWTLVPGYILSQMAGAFTGAVLVYIMFKRQYDETYDEGLILGSFCTSPGIRDYKWNMISEIIATAVLVFGLLGMGHGNNAAINLTTATGEMITGSTSILGPLTTGIFVCAVIGSIAGSTGCLNPCRDLGPRIAHAVLPIKNKGKNDWEYGWIPVAGPIVGAPIGALTYEIFFLGNNVSRNLTLLVAIIVAVVIVFNIVNLRSKKQESKLDLAR